MATKKVVYAKKIYTMSKPDDYHSAMIIEDNIITKLTDRNDIDIVNGKFDEVLDFADNVIIPGFNDSHIHVLGYSKFLESINLVGCSSKKEFLDRIKQKIDSSSPEEWLIGRGWDQEQFLEKEYPNRYEIDTISKNNPILLYRVCGHICVVNTKALEVTGLLKNIKEPNGGKIDLFDDYNPTGILRENAIKLVANKIPDSSFDLRRQRLKKAIKELNRFGITSVQSNDKCL